jgi:uncharacterized protein YaaQ
MRLVIAIVHDEDSHELFDELSEKDYIVSKLASTGGFLRSGNTTFLIGSPADKVDDVFGIIERNCKVRSDIQSTSSIVGEAGNFVSVPIEVTVGGAKVFVVEVERFFKC